MPLQAIGDLLQQGITQSDYSVTGLMLAAGTIGHPLSLSSKWRSGQLDSCSM
jgi:hypothetical protein